MVIRNRVSLFLVMLGLGGCSYKEDPNEAEASKLVDCTRLPQKLPLDEGLQRVISAYAKRNSGPLFCLEYEKISYDSIQMALYSGGNYPPVIDFCRPNFYAEFDNKLVLVSTGAEFVTSGNYYHDTYQDGFYRIVTKKVLGKSYGQAQYEKLHLAPSSYHPKTWRIILHAGDESGRRMYTVVDTLALRTRGIRVPPPAKNQWLSNTD